MSMANVHQVREHSQSKDSTPPLGLDPNRLLDLLDRPIAFHRVFVTLAGSVTAGLMLSQGLYWTRVKLRDDPDSGGWFYHTQEEWEDETGMGRPEQETARKRLRRTGFWQEARRGVPARLFFRVDLERLAEALLTTPPKRGKPRENPQQNRQNAAIQHSSLQGSRRQESDNPADKNATFPQTITETTTEITLPETSPERENNVSPNVGSDRDKTPRKFHLTSRQQDIVEVLEEQLNDTHSRPTFCLIVKRLPEELALGCMHATFDAERAGKIRTSLSAYFIDLVKREALRQGIELGFRRDKA